MKELTLEAFKERLKKDCTEDVRDLSEIRLIGADLSGYSLSHLNIDRSAFVNVIFEGADFSFSSMENALFDGCAFRNVNFQNANMRGASFRYCDMRGSSVKGANLYAAVLEYAKLDDVKEDAYTRWFRMHCPSEGAFLGYKKCVNDRIVRLLVPEDAKRTSATMSSCRCSKAKVLSIESFDGREQFEEAWSLVDENFVYRKGEWVEVPDFNEDRFIDSTTGIHFWMKREEAMGY